MPPKRLRKSKHTFILSKIDPEVVDLKYGFSLLSNIGVDTAAAADTTLITDLPAVQNSDIAHSFVDESKKNHRCIVTMQDLIANERLPASTTTCCWWCRHNFTTTPIGCPVSFVPGKVTKTYHSEITKDKYSITDNISKFRKSILELLMKDHESVFQIKENHEEFFIMDGIFCSFNCCLAYIEDSYTENIYKDSSSLLYCLYQKIFEGANIEDVILKPAPHWRLLRSYGGNMSIEEFRKSFKTVEYIDLDDHVFRMPQCRILGHVFEKKFKF